MFSFLVHDADQGRDHVLGLVSGQGGTGTTALHLDGQPHNTLTTDQAKDMIAALIRIVDEK